MRGETPDNKIKHGIRAFALAAALSAGVAHAQEGTLLYVPNSGGPLEGASVYSLTASGLNLVTTIPDVGAGADQAAVRGDQAFAYVTGSNSNRLSVIDTKTNTVVQTFDATAGLNNPRGVVVSPDGRRVYVANVTGAGVSVFSADPLTGRLTGMAAIALPGAQPRRLAISPDGSRLYAANQNNNSVSVVNTATNQVTNVGGFNTPLGIAVSPDGSRVYVANNGNDRVSVIDTATNTVVASPSTGNGPSAVAVSPNGRFFYVMNAIDGSVSQFNAADNSQIGTPLLVGVLPSHQGTGLAVSPDGVFLYATEFSNAASPDQVRILRIGSDGSLSFNGGISLIGAGDNPGNPGICGNGGAMLAAGATFVANTTGALGCAGPTPTFTGGTLLVNGTGLVFSSAMSLGAGGGIIDTLGNTATISGVISGAGGLSKAGSGSLILSGANNYTGATNVGAGTLQAGAANTFSAASAVTVATGATLNLAGFSQTIASLAGAGSVTLGAATLTEGGNNSSTTFSGAISGSGGLTHAGTGTLTLTGANAYTGATNVNAGMLAVNGSLASAVTVNSGGTLQGTGTIGGASIMSGGVFAPGNSIGTMTVNGNLTFAPGSVFRVETDAAGNADRVNVVGAPGTITINGGTVDVRAGAGTYARNTQYTILTSTGATTGQFAAVTSDLAFLTPSLIYGTNSVTLNLLSGTNFSSVAQTGNQLSVGNYLNGVANNPGSSAALIQQLDNLTVPQARTAFDGLSGSSHASASQIAGATGRTVSASVMNRADAGGTGQGTRAEFRGVQYARLDIEKSGLPVRTMTDAPMQLAQAAPMGGTASKAAAGEAGFWAQAQGTGGNIDSNGNGPGSSYRAAGLMAGYDAMLNSQWMLGGALGYMPTDWDSDVSGGSRSRGSIETPTALIYSRYASGPWQLRMNGGYADHKFKTTRDVTIGAATTTASSTHRGQEWSAAAELEYAMPMGRWELRPLAGLRYASLREDAFNESGTNALQVNGRNTAATNAAAGARALLPFSGGGGGWEFRATVSHLFGDSDSPVSARLAGQPASFTVEGTPLKRTALNLGAGVAGKMTKNMSGYAEATYETRGSGQDAYAVSAGLRVSW